MQIDKDLYLKVKKACIEEQKILSRYEIAKRWNLSDSLARAINTLLKNEQILRDKYVVNVTTFSDAYHADIRFAAVADVHIGNTEHFEDEFCKFLEILNEEEIKTLFIAGDLIDGIKVYPGQEFEIAIVRIEDQIKKAKEELSIYKGNIYYLAGNHEYRVHQLTGIDVGKILESETIHYLGSHRARIHLDNFAVEVWHGAGGRAYALSYKLQKMIDNIPPGTEPRVILAGHLHILMHLPLYRYIDAFHCGCFEGETAYTKRLGLQTTIGGWILHAKHTEGNIISLETKYIAFPVKPKYIFWGRDT